MAVFRRSTEIPWMLAAVCLLGSVGCTPSDPSPVTSAPAATVQTTPSPVESSTTPSSLKPSPTQSPSPSSTLSEDQMAVADTVRDYFALLDELSKDPTMDLEPLLNITTGQSLEVDVSMIQDDRDNGVVQTGDTRFFLKNVSSIIERGNLRLASVTACTDSSDTDLIDGEGNSVLDETRAYFIRWSIEVSFQEDRWKVGDIANERVEGCPP